MQSKFLAVLLAVASCTSMAQTVDVKDGWIRASVPGQMATGAFMTLTAKSAMQLMAVTSPVAGVAEVHEMKIDAGVMKMRAVQGGLELPAGKPVELRSGAYHLMLMDLKAALPKGSTVPLTLVLKDGKGVESRIDITLPVDIKVPMAAHKH